jgi:hypothetical protein
MQTNWWPVTDEEWNYLNRPLPVPKSLTNIYQFV